MERTLYVAQKGQLVPWTIPKRDLKENEVRVDVHSVSINPIDWMTTDNKLADGAGQGNDFAGVVVEVGPNVTSVKIGDTVAGGVGGGDVDSTENGAFTPLLTVDEHLLFKFPHKLKEATPSELSKPAVPTTFEQAASIGLVLDTVALAFEKHHPKGKDEWCLIYGVTSAVGFSAAQFARNIGYHVIGVSGKLPEVTNSLDNVHWLDRNDSQWPEKAKELSNNNIVFTFDAISKGPEVPEIYNAINDVGVVQFVLSTYTIDPKLATAKPHVKIEYPIYFFLMQEHKKFGTARIPDESATIKRAPEIVSGINSQLAKNQIKSLPIKLVNGLENISEALKLSRDGVRGTKIVVKL